jgi:hypothetical protein
MPTSGMQATVAYSAALKRLEIVGYQNRQANALTEQYSQGQNLYRKLREGEFDLVSSGGASSYWGSQPLKTDRAGAVSSKHDGIKLEYAVRSPTFIWRGARNRPDLIGHEMRIGAVKRSTSASDEVYGLKLGSMPDLGQAIYAQEYLLAINADTTDAPLLDVRSGEVYDDVLSPGYPMSMPRLSKTTSFPLRHHAKYYVSVEPGTVAVPYQATEFEVDCLGNVALNLSKLSLLGFAMNVPLGRIAIACGLDMSLDAKLALKLTSIGKMTLNATAGIDITTPAQLTLSGGLGVAIKSSLGKVTVDSTLTTDISGKAGVTLAGAMGKTGRPIATLPNDPVTGVPLFLDASVSN